MKQRFLRRFRWGTMLLVPFLMGIGCIGSGDSPTLRPTSTPLAQPATDPTPVSAPTAAPLVTTVAQRQESGIPALYREEFTDTTSGWPNELVFDNYYIGYHEPDYYHVEVHESNDQTVVPLSDSTSTGAT